MCRCVDQSHDVIVVCGIFSFNPGSHAGVAAALAQHETDVHAAAVVLLYRAPSGADDAAARRPFFIGRGNHHDQHVSRLAGAAALPG